MQLLYNIKTVNEKISSILKKNTAGRIRMPLEWHCTKKKTDDKVKV